MQVEQSCPEQFLGGRVVGDEVYGERGLCDPVDGPIVEGDAVEQEEHAEADHDDGQPPMAGDEYAHVVPQQGQRCGCGGVEKEEAEPNADHQPDLFGGERFHMPLISRNQNEQVDETVVPERLRTLDHGRPWRDDQFASSGVPPSRDMSR